MLHVKTEFIDLKANIYIFNVKFLCGEDNILYFSRVLNIYKETYNE